MVAPLNAINLKRIMGFVCWEKQIVLSQLIKNVQLLHIKMHTISPPPYASGNVTPLEGAINTHTESML